MQKIGIIGSGQVGKTLAKGFLKNNYPVMIASRDAAKQEHLKSEIGGKILVGDLSDATAFGEIIVLAVKGHAAKDALKSIDSSLLSGKIIIDTTNPIAAAPPTSGLVTIGKIC